MQPRNPYATFKSKDEECLDWTTKMYKTDERLNPVGFFSKLDFGDLGDGEETGKSKKRFD